MPNTVPTVIAATPTVAATMGRARPKPLGFVEGAATGAAGDADADVVTASGGMSTVTSRGPARTTTSRFHVERPGARASNEWGPGSTGKGVPNAPGPSA